MKISHAAKGTQAYSKTAWVNVLHLQLFKQKSVTFAVTQGDSLPDITVQVWLVQLWQQYTESGWTTQQYLYSDASN